MMSDDDLKKLAAFLVSELRGNGTGVPGPTWPLPPDFMPSALTIQANLHIMGRDGRWTPLMEDYGLPGAAMVVFTPPIYKQPGLLPPITR